jgi:uncharacterized Zn finger protein (UPF0148 family)
MSDEYTCPNCDQSLDQGALFCGNCGQRVIRVKTDDIDLDDIVVPKRAGYAQDKKLKQETPLISLKNNDQKMNASLPGNQPLVNYIAAAATQASVKPLPAYAIAYPHPKQHHAAIALALGIIGIGAGLIVAILGIFLGIAGIILSTTSYKKSSKGLKISSLTVSVLALLVGIGVWVHAVSTDPGDHSQKVVEAPTANGISVFSVTTPCYSVGFSTELNVNNLKGSCAMNAYNGASVSSSTDIYKVLTNHVSGLNQSNFAALTKKAIESDISKNLPGFNIFSESATQFAGDRAYYVQATDSVQNVAIIEEGILSSSKSSPDNLFVIVHVTEGSSTSLSNLQNTWQWND